jgi:transketolase
MTQAETLNVKESPVSDVAAAHAKAVELGKEVLRMTTAAGSGHPSSARSLAHIVVEIMYRRMRFDPRDPWNASADRLVLSLGHAVPIIYAAYADLGGTVGRSADEARPLTLADLSALREQSSVLDGHPNPAEGFPFFDAATGSLGQGLSVAAGLALAARLDRIDKRIYVIVGDGESREGQVWEAADFVVDQKLTNVCAVFSCNEHGQAGPVSHQQSADAIAAKLAAFGWQVVDVDGHDPAELSAAFDRIGGEAKPTAVVARTVKGWGVDSIIGRNYHGKPLSDSELDAACAELDATGAALGAARTGVMTPPAITASAPTRKSRKAITLPSLAEACERVGLSDALSKKKLATRRAYGVALVALGDADERIVALDGDVSNSTFSNMFAKAHPDRFFECKIAEQNMVTAGAGMAAAGKIPFASSFAKFIARAVDQIDMAAISRANLKIVGSHAGVSLGADGPSQMAVSDVAYFRSLTRVQSDRGGALCHVFHPSDAISAYRCTELMANTDGLCYLRTHRPDADFLYPLDETFTLRGCKQLREGDRLTIVSGGYMLHTALAAADRLADSGIACNVFDAYTFPLDATPILEAARAAGGAILTVEDNYLGGLHAELAEAAAEAGDVRVIGLTANRIPKSAKTAAEVFAHVGVSVERIVEQATRLVRT